jgi:hypothetical protein
MMIITKTEKEEEEDQKRLSRPSCLIFLGESTLFSGKKVLKKKKKTKKKIIFFVSLFFSLDCPFFGCCGICLLYTSSKQERESARENNSEALLRDIYIYVYIVQNNNGR